MKLSQKDLTSAIITFSLWTIFFVCMIFVKIPQKKEEPKYTTIKLQLGNTQVAQQGTQPSHQEPNLEQTPAQELAQTTPTPPEAQPAQTTPTPQEPAQVELAQTPAQAPTQTTPTPQEPAQVELAQTPAQVPAQTTQPAPQKTQAPTQTTQPAPQKTQSAQTTQPAPQKTQAPKPAKPQTLSKSVDELIAEQNAQKTTKKVEDVDWDALFSDSNNVSSNSSSQSNTPKYIENDSSSLSGSAAESSKNQNQKTTVSSQVASENQNTQTTNTQALLDNIKKTEYYISNNNSISSINIETANNGDNQNVTQIKMSDGKIRQLLYPKEPAITLSEQSSLLVDKTFQNIQIVFTVLKDGSVPLSDIKIENEFLLPSSVVQEIKTQLSNWRFQTSQSNGQAGFSYSIIKR